MQDLIQQYKESLRKVRKAKESANEVDRSILSGMERDLEFAIKWMETGRMPGSRRGAERRAAYQREFPADPQRFPFDRFTAHDPFADDDYQIVYGGSTMINVKAEKEIDPIDDKTIGLIDEALSCLSEREREAFEMKRVGGLSYGEIAETLDVNVGTVKSLLHRANKKLDAWKNVNKMPPKR